MQPEIWKDIPGYEGRYQASTEGRIRSVDRYVRVVPASGTEAKRMVKGRVLRPGVYNTGHVSVVLGKGANGSPVHQLIARTFIGECPEGMEVCHNDGNPANNAVENLRYDTRQNNIFDMYRLGTSNKTKVTADMVREIRKMLNAKVKGRDIAKHFGIHECTVSEIKLGKTFTWVKNDENSGD